MVFGVFDRLHPGHLDFFRQAAEHGDELIAVVARDRAVMELKGKQPHHSETERLTMVEEVPEVARAVLGDEARGDYGVIAAYQPNVICVGYDQHELAKDLQAWFIRNRIERSEIYALRPYLSDRFHTSLLS